MSFFQGGLVSKRTSLSVLLPKCGACGLHKSGCKSPKMKSSGGSGSRILIVGDKPSESDDLAGKPFSGKSGSLLKDTIRKLGFDPALDCTFTNSIICKPSGKIDDNAVVGYCRPNLITTIKELEPEVIIPLGHNATQSIIQWVWKEDWGEFRQFIGWNIPCQKINTWICPTWHPTTVEQESSKNPVIRLLWEEHLKKAMSLKGKPHKTVPDYNKLIETTLDSNKATSLIRQLIKAGKATAFDFETDRIKPDSKSASIVCCSVSDGTRTLSFPWIGKAVDAMKEFLMSDVPKIGYNIKFEDRWVAKVCGRSAKNWLWDGQIASHILDNRDRITSLKFQSFVRLGAPDYDSAVKPYLSLTEEGFGANGRNRIREIDPKVLMTYNAIDSLLEWQLAMIQMKEIGYGDQD